MEENNKKINLTPPENIVLCISENKMLWSLEEENVAKIKSDNLSVRIITHLSKEKRQKPISLKNSFTVSSH